ncbi:MAG: tRNA dihydrouridine synthase DusB [Oscillospiraceae bacterium]|jgi:nifR3 family TIM-barrel protein|nr:tRNA dihydrouridine synthase DusB [Oscillospiraceae bacterium]
MKIGNIEIKRAAMLAPMASAADTAYRLIHRECGAASVISEMISAKGLCYNDSNTAQLCTVLPDEEPMALQLFGSEPKFMAKAARICAAYNSERKYKNIWLDINMGCPVKKVVSGGAGSALMKNPALAGDIVRAVKAVTDIPVTVKIRKGFEENNAVEFAKEMERAGADAITVHPRLRTEFFTGKSDWNIIRDVKQAVKIPVIGNGDVCCLEDCIEMYRHTGCDLVMIGRASFGNPFIFKEINAYYEGIPYTAPDFQETVRIMERHIQLLIKFKGERIGIAHARKHTASYVKGMSGAAALRKQAHEMTDMHSVQSFIKQLTNSHKERQLI